jgi:thioredoxin
MKKLSIYAFFLLILISCGNAKKTINENQEQKTMKPIHLTTADFNKKIVSLNVDTDEWKYLGDKPCLIDFYADWCGPCKVIAPFLEEFAAEYGDQIYIYKVDVDKERELSEIFGIQSIPTLLLVPMNNTPQIIQGALPKNELKNAIEEILLKKMENGE